MDPRLIATSKSTAWKAKVVLPIDSLIIIFFNEKVIAGTEAHFDCKNK